jgi:putative NADPH-quinone reductase
MKVLVVYCHPVEGSFVSAVRDRVLAGLDRAGHEVRLTDLYADGFEPRMSAFERLHHKDAPEAKPEILPSAADLAWCEALVLVYPTWWAGQPAMLKGWIDRVWVQGVAWELPEGTNRLRPKLRNVRRLVAVTTHGSKKYVNVLEGEAGKRVVTRSLRVLCHPLVRTTWLAMYGLDTADDARRARFLDRVERRFARL